MRQVDIFFKISNARQCWFTCFVRFANMKLFCKSANENKTNFMFATLTKHVNNQANCCITLEKLKKIWIHLAVTTGKLGHLDDVLVYCAHVHEVSYNSSWDRNTTSENCFLKVHTKCIPWELWYHEHNILCT